MRPTWHVQYLQTYVQYTGGLESMDCDAVAVKKMVSEPIDLCRLEDLRLDIGCSAVESSPM